MKTTALVASCLLISSVAADDNNDGTCVAPNNCYMYSDSDCKTSVDPTDDQKKAFDDYIKKGFTVASSSSGGTNIQVYLVKHN